MSSAAEETNNNNTDIALSQLLAALAAGARAVQALPVGDDFDYTSSFPEFSRALQKTTEDSLMETIQDMLRPLRENDDDDTVHPDVWEECADACDALVEQVESFLLHSSAATTTSVATTTDLQHWSAKARQKSSSTLQRMIQGTDMDMKKPQLVHGIAPVHCQKAASRTDPFIPPVHPDKPFHTVPLDMTLRKGHGLKESSNNRRVWMSSQGLVAPSHHLPHVYQTEIEALEYRDWQLQATRPSTPQIVATADNDRLLQATWIDTTADLQKLASRLEHVRYVAIDLEAHSYRSFAGLVCLMQISVRANDRGEDGVASAPSSDGSSSTMENYLIDTLALFHHINPCLAPMLANPDIVKVFHGADSDIAWLQRDFGCYVVNLFDTGRAARALQFPSAGYAYLLQHYGGVTADKSLQLADWRQRPLSTALQQYAIADTHYLLDIYDRLLWDLETNSATSIRQVLDDSKKVSLIRYGGESFQPAGYKKLMNGGGGRRRGTKTRTKLNASQEAVLKTLWDWRDLTARAHDESLPFVCTNANLLRMGLSTPTTVGALQSLFNPIPPLVLSHSQEILDRIKAAVMEARDNNDEEEEEEEDEEVAARQAVGTRSSAFFKPANTEKDALRREGIMSPVLGTEALYKQAGWTTPSSEQQGVELTTTTEEDDETTDPAEKPKRLLSVHASNQQYRSKKPSEHSLSGGNRGRSADGMGTVRAARENSRSPVPTTSIQEEAKQAKQNAAILQSGLLQKESIPVVLGMISPTGTTDVEDEEGGDEVESGTKERDETGGDTDEEFAIPRSMKEIYKISNRNRRNKKAGSPTPERGVTPTSEKEREELLKAEALLKVRGSVYFDTGEASTVKRPRTRSRTGRESEESVPQESPNSASKEDDLTFMQDIGWIKSKKEGQQLMEERYGRFKPGGRGEAEDAPIKELNRHGTYGAGGGFDYSSGVGVMPTTQSSNPFFAGASLTGGPLAQNFGKPEPRAKKTGQGKGKQHRRQERPEKKDGRTHAYRKR